MCISMVEDSKSPNDKRFCACGCMTLIDPIDKKYRPRKFKHGHTMKNKFGHEAPRWKGGRKRQRGYWIVFNRGHPRADKLGYLREHILVFERANNCCTLRWCDVHHKDGNTENNTPENLEGMMHGEHSFLHHKGAKYKKRFR